ncbi:MAG: hypothetical protein QXG97_01135, partial [Nitrososphaerota archaeon]
MKRLIIATISISLIIGILVGFLSSSMLISRVTVTERFTYTYTSKTVYTTTIRHTETVTITKSESEIKYARLFKVTEFDDYKIVKDALNRTLILVPRNKSPPIGVEGIVIYVPVERVILMSATQVALLMRLKEYRPDILDTVVGIMWGGQYEWYFK